MQIFLHPLSFTLKPLTFFPKKAPTPNMSHLVPSTGNAMIKLIHLDTGEDLRGGQQQLLMLARGLAAGGHQQLVVTLDGTALEAQARQEGFRMFALPRHDPAGAYGIFQLRQLLLAEPFQVLHAHDGKGQTISWLASLGLNAKRVA